MSKSIASPPPIALGGTPASVWQLIPLAGASNALAACFTNGFDLIKVRQQLQVSSGTTGSTFWGKTLVDMVKKEGVLSLYKGLSAAILREAVYSGIRMGCYDASKALVLRVVPYGDKDMLVVKLGAGLGSGMLGAAIASPADLLKASLFYLMTHEREADMQRSSEQVRMQAVGATGTLRWHARNIYEMNGIAGLYRAVFPTILRAGILTASQVGTYDHAKHTLMVDFPGVFQEGLQTHFAASGIAGFCCSLASSPVDVVKVRIMSDKTAQYKNAVHCAALMMKNEGPLAFYKGFTMCFLRLWPHSILSLLAFEQMRKAAGIKPI